jgi:hypothetical protein
MLTEGEKEFLQDNPEVFRILEKLLKMELTHFEQRLVTSPAKPDALMEARLHLEGAKMLCARIKGKQ